MCTFPEPLKMALSLGVVWRDEEMSRVGLKEGKSGLALFMACLRRNPENYSNGEKSKSVYFCHLVLFCSLNLTPRALPDHTTGNTCSVSPVNGIID
jgi:hypothetical protein